MEVNRDKVLLGQFLQLIAEEAVFDVVKVGVLRRSKEVTAVWSAPANKSAHWR